MIVVAASEAELKNEGAALSHCVGAGRYAKKMLKGESFIFFIRKTEEPDKPFFTMEFFNNEVLQCRTKNNVSYKTDRNIAEFVEQWQRQIPQLLANSTTKPKEAA